MNFDLDNYASEFDVTAQATDMLRMAKTPAEKRQALILWLHGAAVQVDGEYAVSPAHALIGALEALDNGVRSSLFDGADQLPGEVDALARAVVATTILANVGKKAKVKGAVRQARAFVCSLNGMDEKSLMNLVAKVGAGMPHVRDGNYRPGQRYIPVIERVAAEREKWRARQRFMASWSQPFSLLQAIAIDLSNDRLILSR